MHKLYGVFDLGDEVREAEFSSVFSALREHLVEAGLIVDGRMLRRVPHENYESDPPNLAFLVELDFESSDQAERCWDYIEDPDSAGRPVHHAMISLMGKYRFALYEAPA
jgi:hypothetical protein